MSITAASVPLSHRGRALVAALAALFLILAGAFVAVPAMADDGDGDATTSEVGGDEANADETGSDEAETDETGFDEGEDGGETDVADSLDGLGAFTAFGTLDEDGGPSAPSVVVSKVRGLNGEGETITVTGTGFVANPPATDATRAPVGAGNFGGVYVVFAKWPTLWAPSESGTRPTAGNLAQRWGVHAAQFGGSINAGNGGFVLPEDGSFELTFTVSDSSALSGNYGIYTYAGGGATYAPFETFTSLAFAGPPSVHVSKNTGLNPEGETITVTLTDFLPDPPATDATRAPVGAGNFGGVYVVFGKWPTLWAPSESGTRPTAGNLAQRWGVHAAQFGGSINAGNGGFILPADGTAELTFTVSDSSLLDGNYGIYTYAGGGATYAPFETFTPLTFTGSPAVEVSKTTGLDPEGETITVKLTDFLANPPATDATRAPVGAGNFGGVYVVFGKWPALWAPSESGTRPTAGNLAQRWGVHAAQFGGSINAGNGGFILPVDGSYELTFNVADLSELEGNYGIYTYAGGGAVYAPFETFTPLSFEAVTTEPEEPEEPTVPTTPTAPAGGSLRWAISSDFTGYITSIAHGEIIVSGGATRSGGQFQWGQGSGSTYDFDTGLGTIPYTGSVRFTGHGGVLDVTMSNPRITITSASAATLSFASGGSRVTFATLNLAGGAKTTASNGAVTYTAVPASLTAAGRDQILEGFATSLNPLTFTIGSPAAAPAGSTGTVASATTPDGELPSEPPATTGIEITDADLAALQSGQPFTITGSGFQPDEEGIDVVVYSTPVLLGTVKANANGVATWTGYLPADLANGEHTLTLQGSVAHGLVFALDRSAPLQSVGECSVTGATLRWGFREAFRVYIESIAKGGWELDGIEYSYPDFVWTGGTGSFSAGTGTGLVEFGGTLRFHGHEGALDTTLTNARIELAGDTGYLVFDVAGETQGGEDVDAKSVRFAEFSLAGIAPVNGVLTLDALPATLTAAGAAAFGTYPAGEALDPVSAVIPVGADCGVSTGEPGGEGQEEPGATEDSAPVWPWIAGGLVLAALIAGGVVIARRRSAKADA